VRPLGVIGNIAVDLVEGGRPRIGGGPYYCARALNALRRPAVVVAKAGAQERETLLRSLVALGLPVRCMAARGTATFSMRYDGDHREMRLEALGDPWTPQEASGWVARALERVTWVHVAPLARTDFPAETLAALARGRRLSLDGQGLVRVPQPGPLALDADFDPEVLRHVSILKLSEEEAAVLVDGLDERALRELGVPEVVVTLGSRGAIVFVDGVAEHVPATPARRARDPTGAGDAFAAGYLAARSSGHAPAASARQASALVASLLSERRR
jgi:sugar/nucleoside kinase (ribokinase family)